MSDKEERTVQGPSAEETGAGEGTAEEQPREPQTEENMDDRIEKAMAKIISDTAEEQQSEHSGAEEPVMAEEQPETPAQQEPSVKEEPVKQPEPAVSGQSAAAPAAGQPAGPMKVKPMPKGQPIRGKAKPVVKSPADRNWQKVKSAYYREDDIAPRKKSSHKVLKSMGIVAAMVVVTAGCAYGMLSYYYSNRFFQGTTINGIDCSGLTVAEVEEKIADRVENYSIEVTARDMEPQSISGDSIDYEYMPDGSVGKALEEQDPLQWISGYFGEREVTASTNISYSREKLSEQFHTLECTKPENQIAPEDAYVTFQDTQFVIVPETEGRTLDVDKAQTVVEEAVNESADQVSLDRDELYTKAAVRSDNPELVAELESCNAYTRASITYTFGEETRTLDGATIKDWLTLDENGHLVKDNASLSQHISEYVAQLAAEFDTVGSERNFHTTTGRDIVVGGGNYGWQIDQAAEAAQLLTEITGGQTVTREPVYEVRAMQAGRDDIGSTYIEVDLSSQHMWFYQNGSVIFESDFVSGDMRYTDRMTPSGVCHLYYKQRDQVLRGDKKPDGTYEYEQPVSYWMPFNGGVGFHDANWRGSFGGDIYMGNGSHGCINMPPSNAATLYDLINTEVPIVVFY